MSVKYKENLQVGGLTDLEPTLPEVSICSAQEREPSFSNGNFMQKETQKKGVSSLNVMASEHLSVNRSNPYE